MKILLRYLAYILIISAFFRVIPIAAALIYGESPVLFFISFIVSIVVGLAFLWAGEKWKNAKGKGDTISLKGGIMLAALSFMLLPVIGSISFLPSFGYSLLNALFESVSGFTTTGLTLYSSLDALPKSLLLWRAETQWIGGIGIIMVFLFIFSRLKSHSYSTVSEIESKAETTASLYQAQGFPERLEPSLRKTVSSILWIYGAYTIIGIILLFAVGMPIFDSVAMSFTSLSTGGFAVNDSFYSSSLQLAVLGLLMIMGAFSFLAHNKLLQRKFREFFSYFEKNVFLVIVAVAAVLAFVSYPNAKVALFQIVSAFTTTGYSIAEISILPHLFIFLIMVGMVIGGNIASTAGGMKVFRVYYAFKSIPWLLKKLVSPANAIIPFKVNNNSVEESSLMIIEIFVLCYIFILLAGTVILMLFGYDFLQSSFQVTSALGTVGLQTMELSALHWVCKLVLMAAMLLGRLEIFPILILFKGIFRK